MRYDYSTSPVVHGNAFNYLTSMESDMGEVKIGEYEEMKNKLRQAQDENVKLQEVISDLTQVNKRWQRYNNDRQMYVQKLLSTIQDQQIQINNMGEEKAFPSKQLETATESVCSRPDCKAMRDELQKLVEKVELLEFQVKAHKDDWEAERNEKQQALKDRDLMKIRLQETLRELYAIKGYQSEPAKETILNECKFCMHKEADLVKLYNNSSKPPFTTVRMGSSSISSPRTNHHFFSMDGLECDGGFPQFSDELKSPTVDTQLGAIPKSPFTKEKSSDSLSSKLTKLKNYEIDNIETEDNACALRPKEESYSQTSTVPMLSPTKVSPCESLVSLHSNATNKQTVSLDINNGQTSVTSFVQLPVVKSSSAPERRSSNFKKPPKCINSISLSVLAPSAQKTKSPRINEDSNDGEETETKEDMVCLGCQTIFPPNMHLEFLDHCDKCHKK